MNTPKAETCACGSGHWHTALPPEHPAFLWCTRCGAIRFLFEDFWNLTLDSPEVAERPPAGEFELPNEDPTHPGTPSAKGRPPVPRRGR